MQLDAAHTAAGGLLYRAFTQDAARHMVMLVECWDARNEADDPWHDFMHELVSIHPSMNSARYTLLSDMQKGILKAAKEALPLMHRALCSKHMQANVIKVAGTAMLPVFEEAAFATRPEKFIKAMEKATPKLTNYLTVEHPKEEWAKLYHPGEMGGKMASSVRHRNTFAHFFLAYLSNLIRFKLPYHFIGSGSDEWRG